MTPKWSELLDETIDRRFETMVDIRRHLHAHPELSGDERQTSLFLYQLLGDEDLDVRMGPDGCGVIVDSGNDTEVATAQRIALRADIDALQIHDTKEVTYRSQCDGVMHACGHDAHTAIVFGATAALQELANTNCLPWPVPLRSVFQPAEEICTGAKSMIDVGVLDGVAGILSIHMDPSRKVGKIGWRTGVLTANCDEMHVTITGRGGHAARPHEASDPIAAAAQLINALYLFIPRATDSQDAVVVTVGQVVGGEMANVIPEQVKLRGTVRTLDRTVRTNTFDHIYRLAQGIGKTTETEIKVHWGIAAPSVVNDEQMTSLLRCAAREVLGENGLEEIERPSMGSEDFAFYLDEVPGAMIRIGCASSQLGNAALHSTLFDIDEESIRIAAKILARSAVRWADPQGPHKHKHKKINTDLGAGI